MCGTEDNLFFDECDNYDNGSENILRRNIMKFTKKIQIE